MEPDGGLSPTQAGGKSQLAPMEHVAATTRSDTGSENPADSGVTGTDEVILCGHDATNNDAALAKGLARSDPAAEAEVRANAVLFVTVDRRKAKKQKKASDKEADDNMSRVNTDQYGGKSRKPNHAGRKPRPKAAAGRERKGDGRLTTRATAVDKYLYQLCGFIEQQSEVVTIMEQVKRVQDMETAAGKSLLTRTIVIDGDDGAARATLRQQLTEWIMHEHVAIQVVKQRLGQILLNLTTVPTPAPRMDWRAALKGHQEPREPEAEPDTTQRPSDRQRSEHAKGKGRELPAGPSPRVYRRKWNRGSCRN